jgi:hypothetical protein
VFRGAGGQEAPIRRDQIDGEEIITFHRIMWWSPDALRDPLAIVQSYPHLGSSVATTI